ncbi:MAG: hypothetical protein QOE63_125, partial [Acidimicrobiaceae bacterium]
MPRALIAGAFGQGNPGDEALLDAHLRVLRDVGWDAIVTSATPATTEARHACAAVAPRVDTVGRALLDVDALVVGGGTLFKPLHPSSGRRAGALLARTAALTFAAKAAGRPVALSAVGAAPLARPSHRQLARCILRWSDLLVLRDEESATELEAAGGRP